MYLPEYLEISRTDYVNRFVWGMCILKTPADYFSDTAQSWPSNEFLFVPSYKSGNVVRAKESFTYEQAERAIGELVQIYRAANIVSGIRVGLMLENSATFFMHWLALSTIGATLVPLNQELAPQDCAHIIRDSGLCLIACFSDLVPIIEAALEHVENEVAIWNIEGALVPKITTQSVTAGDECALLYTSGSTGLPKGCILTNEYFEIAGQAYIGLGGLCALEEGRERLATPLPQVHMNALACSNMAMIMTGGCIIQLDRFHPQTWWQQMVDAKATIIHYLGVVPAILLQIAETPVEKQHTIKFAFGAGVNPKHHAVFEKRFGFPLVEAWSMTEVGGAAWIVARHEPRHVGQCCMGKPDDTMDYRIVNDNDKDVAIGEAGELLVRRRGDNPRQGFFAGYHGQPELTREIWRDNWLHSGDIVKAGDDGSLYFVDRKKSIIRRSGENISSLEVETVLSEANDIVSVGVTPVADEIRGEEVMACIVLSDMVAADEKQAASIVDYALKKLAYYKVPGYVAFVDKLPLTPSQKLQRGELKIIAKKLVEDSKVYDMRSMKKYKKAL